MLCTDLTFTGHFAEHTLHMATNSQTDVPNDLHTIFNVNEKPKSF